MQTHALARFVGIFVYILIQVSFKLSESILLLWINIWREKIAKAKSVSGPTV